MRMTRDWWAVLLAAVAAVLVKLGVVAGCAMVTVTAPRGPTRSDVLRQRLALLPGLFLLGLVGYAGKLTEQSLASYGEAHQLTLPNIEYVLWAIVFGLIVSNTVGVPKICRAGVDTYEFWLKAGIVLLGVRFLLGDIVKLGGVSLVCVVLELAMAIAVMTALGRWFRLSPKLTSLLSIGASICGVSAIIAAKGAIDADDEDASYAIAAILALGAVSLVVFPLVGRALGMSDHAYGLWVGLAVDNTAEAAAAGALYSDAAGQLRRAREDDAQRDDRIRRARLRAVLGAHGPERREIANKGAFLWEKFPKFVLGFLVDLDASPRWARSRRRRSTDLANLSRWAFLFTFAGVGLRTNVASCRRRAGGRSRSASSAKFAIAVLTLAMVVFAARTLRVLTTAACRAAPRT